jgi:hypothetical protein
MVLSPELTVVQKAGPLITQAVPPAFGTYDPEQVRHLAWVESQVRQLASMVVQGEQLEPIGENVGEQTAQILLSTAFMVAQLVGGVMQL